MAHGLARKKRRKIPPHQRRTVIGGESMTVAHALRRMRARIRIGDCAALAGALYVVPPAYITGIRPDDPARRPKAETDARALTAYLAHTSCGISKKIVASVMEMEWSQLNRAIRDIEDRRDDPRFDEALGRLEAKLEDGE